MVKVGAAFGGKKFTVAKVGLGQRVEVLGCRPGLMVEGLGSRVESPSTHDNPSVCPTHGITCI